MAYIISYLLRALKHYSNVKVLMLLVPIVLITNTILYIQLFSKPTAVVIPLEDIPLHIVTVPQSKIHTTGVKYCDIAYRDMKNLLKYPKVGVSDDELKPLAVETNIKLGGAWSPKVCTCTSLDKVAIVIPYRNRHANVRDFLFYIHPFLQTQLLDYRIIIVEQSKDSKFNRAKLFNVGFKEAQKIDDFLCFIFHDVDLIPQNLNNMYACTELPRHMSANINIHYYKLPYDRLIGGAVAILKEQFINANGFSNTFFGWGGEDDDFYYRIIRENRKICRFASDVSQYIMLPHRKQAPSQQRYYFLFTDINRYKTDGLNSLKYTVLRMEMLPLYTKILVEL